MRNKTHTHNEIVVARTETTGAPGTRTKDTIKGNGTRDTDEGHIKRSGTMDTSSF